MEAKKQKKKTVPLSVVPDSGSENEKQTSQLLDFSVPFIRVPGYLPLDPGIDPPPLPSSVLYTRLTPAG